MTTADEVYSAIRVRFAPNEYALLPQVRNRSGFADGDVARGGPVRYADAIAVGLWASRGNPIHGFEIKVARADWLKELKAPDKAEPVAAFCNYWWIAAPPNVAAALEVPDGWGLLTFTPNGTLKTAKDAPRRDGAPLTAGFVSSVLRRAAEALPGEQELKARYDLGWKEGTAAAHKSDQWSLANEKEQREGLQRLIAEFEEAAGIRLQTYQGGKQLGEAVRLVLQQEGKGWEGNARRQFTAMRRAAVEFLDASQEFAQPDELEHVYRPGPLAKALAEAQGIREGGDPEADQW